MGESEYIKRAHLEGLARTKRWDEKPPVTSSEWFEYGEYLFDIKDYVNAVHIFEKGVTANYIPACFALAYCLTKSLGTMYNPNRARPLFEKIVEEESYMEPTYRYYWGMCYAYGWGTSINKEKALQYFLNTSKYKPAAYREIGNFYFEGINPCKKDIPTAIFYYRRAYDALDDEAIFQMEKVFTSLNQPYPDMRELMQAYTFRAGRLLRVAENFPSRDSLMRLATFYDNGFPGDGAANREKFKKWAENYFEEASKVNR